MIIFIDTNIMFVFHSSITNYENSMRNTIRRAMLMRRLGFQSEKSIKFEFHSCDANVYGFMKNVCVFKWKLCWKKPKKRTTLKHRMLEKRANLWRPLIYWCLDFFLLLNCKMIAIPRIGLHSLHWRNNVCWKWLQCL